MSKIVLKYILLSIILFGFNGCDFNFIKSNKDIEQKMQAQKKIFEKKVQDLKEIKLKELDLKTKKELAILASKKELAKIEKEKELEKIRLNAQFEREKLQIEIQKQKLAFEQKLQEKKEAYNMELKRYGILVLIILILVISFFIYFYFKRKRDNKLQAYKDNLEKYFRQKENETRIQIANRMLDLLQEGKLDKNQEDQLINAFSGAYSNKTIEDKKQKFLEDKKNIQDIEVLE